MIVKNGEISTIVISVVTVLFGALITWISQNPTLVSNFLGTYGLASFTPIVVSVAVVIYNGKYKRADDVKTPVEEILEPVNGSDEEDSA